MSGQPKIKCPYCTEIKYSNGMFGHVRGKHPEKLEQYRKDHPPKLTKPSAISPNIPEPIKEPEPEESMTEEIESILDEPEQSQEQIKEQLKPEPAPKLEPKPEPELKKESGDQKPVKGKSFLDWLLGEDEDNKSDISKPDKKDINNDDWW